MSVDRHSGHELSEGKCFSFEINPHSVHRSIRLKLKPLIL